jgi:hypothetical protein
MASRRRQYAPSSRNCWPVPTPISSSPAVCLTARCSIQLLTLGLQSDYASIALGLLDYNSSAPRLVKSPKVMTLWFAIQDAFGHPKYLQFIRRF